MTKPSSNIPQTAGLMSGKQVRVAANVYKRTKSWAKICVLSGWLLHTGMPNAPKKLKWTECISVLDLNKDGEWHHVTETIFTARSSLLGGGNTYIFSSWASLYCAMIASLFWEA